MDTIVAEATPKGRGGVGIVRLSGPLFYRIAAEITRQQLKLRYAEFTGFYAEDQSLIDQGIALFFQGPHSFTGEDVVELQCHGGPMVIDRLLAASLHFGARLARPGEFSERAFLNGKIDLIQAEAISDLIAAETEAGARAALCSLQGEFSAQIQALVERLIQLRLFIEATLDFPDEDIEFVEKAKVIESLTTILAIFYTLRGTARTGVLLQEGIQVALIGKPNAGKSSLLNRLAQKDIAMVSEIPGTTRDVIREKINLQGIPLHVVDTAGLRQSEDVLEREGIRRTEQALKEADLVLLLVDVRHPTDLQDILQEYQEDLQNRSVLTIFNKIDLVDEGAAIDGNTVRLSVKTGAGLEHLQHLLLQTLGVRAMGAGQFSARRRHLEALTRAGAALETGLHAYRQHQSLELLAEECRIAQEALAEITGEFRADDLLGAIFSTFCIGK